MTPPPSRRRSRYVRCRWCGLVLPGWLTLPNEPDSAMLLYHLGARHHGTCWPSLERMDTEGIDPVLMEIFERVRDDPARPQ